MLRGRCRAVFCALALALAASWPSGSFAQGSAQIESVQIGFSANYSLGHWTPVRVVASGLDESAGTLVLQALDGDATACRIESPILLQQGANDLRGLVKFGRRQGGLTVQLLDASGQLLVGQHLTQQQLSEQHRAHSSRRPFVLGVGKDLDIASALGLDRRMQDEDEQTLVVAPLAAEQLPDHWLGLDSVASIVITTSDLDVVGQLRPEQIDALQKWVQAGGRLILSAASNAAQTVGSNGILSALMPARFVRTSTLRDTGSLELFAESTEPLIAPGGAPLAISRLTDVEGIVALQVDEDPLIVRQPRGFGEVVFVAIDLDEPRFQQWPGSTRFVGSLLGATAKALESNAPSRSGRVSHYGYEDIAGQVRAALDQFEGVSFITFTLVAVLVGVFILVIGPADYFLLSKVFRRMELTWLTFTFAVLLFCIMAVLIVRGSKSSRLQINQVEIVDIDASSGMVRGSFWAHVYSPTTREYDFSISEPPLPGCATTDRILSWQGLPGAGLGGMQSNNDMGGIRTSYVCPLQWSEDSAECRMQGVPIPIGSTKALFGRWLGARAMQATSRLSQHRRLDALVGTVTNPLPVELSNCVLVYKDWAYVLNRPLSPGETVDIETELQERTLAFIRRRATGEQAATATWDPTDRELPRILEMMMFFDAIGGTEYTRLSNLYHRDIDLSHLRHLGRAMLIGRVRGTATTISVDGRVDPGDYDQRLTMVRLVLPVEPRTSNQAGRLP